MVKKYKYFIIAPIILIFAFSFCSEKANSENDKGIDFVFNDLNDKPVKLSDFRGKVVLVNIWATWCGPCRAEIPSFINLYNKYKNKGFEIIGVSMDVQGKKIVKPFAEEFKINYTLVIGERNGIFETFGPINGIPTTFLVDKEGVIKNKYVGMRPEKVFEKDILKLLNN